MLYSPKWTMEATMAAWAWPFVKCVINMFGLAATTGGDDGNIDGIGNHGSYYKFITVFGAVGIY